MIDKLQRETIVSSSFFRENFSWHWGLLVDKSELNKKVRGEVENARLGGTEEWTSRRLCCAAVTAAAS